MQKPLWKGRPAKIVLIFLVIALLTYLVGYFASVNSKAFSEAQKFIHESQIVSNELGHIVDINLTPFGYELEFAGSSGSASFDCKIKGSKANGEAVIRLQKNFDTWHITQAVLQVNGREVPLI